MRTIEIGANTKEAHEKFIAWLNGLLNNYKSSFYDTAIQNILSLSFIKKHHSFIQELYLNNGVEFVGFMSVIPTDTTNYILMIHDVEGEPVMYNKENGADLFNFDSEGKLTNFFENVTVPLYDTLGNQTAECFITFREIYGIKVPMYIIKNPGDNTLLGEGFVDFNFEGKFSGTYMVETLPMDELPYFEVRVLSLSTMVMEVPLLKNLNLKYEFKPGHRVVLPYTEHVEYFLRQTKVLGGIDYKLVRP